jgi:hypothetical protein
MIINGGGKLIISLNEGQRLLDNAKDKAEKAGMKEYLIIESKGDKIAITQPCSYPEGNSINHVQ